MSGTSVRAGADRTLPGPRTVMVKVPTAVLFVNIALAGNNALVAAVLYRLTGSASNFALILVSNFAIAAVVQLVAGYVVDRLGARRLAVLSEAAACAAIALEAAVSRLDSPVVPLICGAALVSVVQAFYRAAMFTLAPQLAGKERLAALNAKINAAFQAGTLLGTPAGTLLLYLAPVWGFCVLAVSFGAAALILGTLPDLSARGAGGGAAARGRTGVLRELRAQRGLITHILLCSGDYVAVYLFTLIIVPLVDDRFGGSTLTLAVVNSALPAGVMLSGLLPWRSQSPERTLRLVVLSMAVLLAAFLLLIRDVGVAGTVGCVVAVGFAAGSSQTLLMTALQLRSPAHVLGRVASLRLFVASGLAAPTLAGASYLLKDGVGTALAFCAGVEALYLTVLLVLSRRRLLGHRTLAAAPGDTAD
ncbi:MFS transporter [Streptomyces cinerochromogenes]|uniref:MFS transporter n=1 Tax=Streptomyces cinerochromogenes TaxID=66422 RepID=UPI0036A33591